MHFRETVRPRQVCGVDWVLAVLGSGQDQHGGGLLQGSEANGGDGGYVQWNGHAPSHRRRLRSSRSLLERLESSQ